MVATGINKEVCPFDVTYHLSIVSIGLAALSCSWAELQRILQHTEKSTTKKHYQVADFWGEMWVLPIAWNWSGPIINSRDASSLNEQLFPFVKLGSSWRDPIRQHFWWGLVFLWFYTSGPEGEASQIHLAKTETNLIKTENSSMDFEGNLFLDISHTDVTVNIVEVPQNF